MNNSSTTWKQLVESSDAEIIRWAGEQAWSVPMKECSQDPIWHAEGDVWTHTLMVCDQLSKLDAWQQLTQHEQIILLFTAIFHDSGKPKVTITDPETGRIQSPRHARVGMRIARRALIDLQCEFQTREQICHLILFHGRPPYLGKNDSAESEVIKISNYCENRLLYLFALADYRGRICKQQSTKEEKLEYWKLVSEEQGCLTNAYQFTNDQARVLFHQGSLDNLHYAPHEEYRCSMTIMSGLPGAGKDTWLQTNWPDLPVVSLDAIRKELKISPTDNQGIVVQTARERCKEHLRSNTDFALNATNITRQVRQLWCGLAADYNARIKIAYIEPDLPLLLNQNAGREARVPRDVIEKLIDKLDPPTLAECHELTVDTASSQYC